MESALELCRTGLAAAYLPSFIARLHNQTVKTELRLQSLPSPKGLRGNSQPVYLARRKEDSEDQIVRGVAKTLRQICAQQ